MPSISSTWRQYLYGVVGKEIGYGYHIEATKAQAVAARSYAIGNISSRNTYYDVTATTSSQVYGGYSGETSRMREAVGRYQGMVLTYNDAVIQAYFSSNAGGYTENIENVWVSDAVPIKGVPSPTTPMPPITVHTARFAVVDGRVHPCGAG